jgi:uncharacterized protein involved in exopolysaccharide biosynthesis
VPGKRFAAILFRRKHAFLLLFPLLFAAVAIATFLMPRQYESRMRILVKNERADLVVSPDARDRSQPPGDVSEAQVNSEIELLTSNDLLVRVVRVCHLYETAEKAAHATFAPRPETFERAVRKLQRDLKITPVRKANVIEISYSATSPERAASVLRELLKGYLDAHLNVHRSAGTEEFFRGQTASYEAQLHDAENRVSDFRRRNNLTSIAEQKEIVSRKVAESESALREADAALAETATRVRELRDQLAAQDRRIVTQSRSLPNQYSVERLNTMLAELENRRTEALMKFRPDDRVVVEIEDEIANTKAALDRASKMVSVEQASDVNPLRRDLESELAHTAIQEAGLRSRRASLAGTLAFYRANLAQLEGATIEYDTLERNVKEAEENYLLYARKEEEARIADSLDQQKIANVAVAESPVVPHLPSTKTGLNLALGLLLAAFVSLGAAFGAEVADTSFHTPAELEAATGFPVLATAPLYRH